MTTDPNIDQKRARLADLQRLRELILPHLAGPEVDALSRMPAAEASEARELLDRIGPIGEDPAITAARQEELLRLAEIEGIIHEVLGRPHYKVCGGKVVTDPDTGEPVPDDAFERAIRARLAVVERMRERLTGLLPADEPGDSAH